MGRTATCYVVFTALLAFRVAHAACPAMRVSFFPPDTTNVPVGWTQEAQAAAGNADTGSLAVISLSAQPMPRLYIQPEHPLFVEGACVPADCLPAGSNPKRKLAAAKDSAAEGEGNMEAAEAMAGSSSALEYQLPAMPLDSSSSSPSSRQLLATCHTTVLEPAAYGIMYNIDGGVDRKVTFAVLSAPYITLPGLDALTPGKHTLNFEVTMLKGTGEVHNVSALQPAADQAFSTKVVFNLLEGEAALPAAAAPPPPPQAAYSAAGGLRTAAPDTAAAGDGAPTTANAAAPGETLVQADAAAPAATTTAKEDTDAEPAIVDSTIAQQAVKYYCMRQYNVGGRIHSNVQVSAGDDGIMECAAGCNALGAACAGFGLTGRTCYRMQSFNTNSSAADATLDALCMKSVTDWLDFGVWNAAQVGAGFYCLRGYDLKGNPAGSGDAESPVQSQNTEIPSSTPSTCATTCKSTVGCQYMLIKKPLAASSITATCYLKMHALGGLYGITGPDSAVALTCINGQDQWLEFGAQLAYALPSPEVDGRGVETPAVPGIAPVNGSIQSYQCIKQYSVTGTQLATAQVAAGDDGLIQCASSCDAQDGACIAYYTTDSGTCNMLKSINFNLSTPQPKVYGMCFAKALDWNRLGNPDANDMYCLSNYQFTGDAVRNVSSQGIATGAAAVSFCKQQCVADPDCQFVVTSAGSCSLRVNILSGSTGATQPDVTVQSSCVKGEANWAAAALHVSAAPTAVGLANFPTRRAAAATSNAAGFNTQPLLWPWMLVCSFYVCWLTTSLQSCKSAVPAPAGVVPRNC